MKPLNLSGKRGMLSLDVVTYAPRCVGQTGCACEGDASIANALKKAIDRAASPTNGNHLIAIPCCFSDNLQTVWKRFAVSRIRLSVAGDGGFSRRR